MENPVMNILIFSPFYPPHIGGLESHSDEFNQYLARHGTHITVFTPHLPTDAPKEETRYNNVHIIRFPAFEPIHNYPIPKFWQVIFWQQWKSLCKKDYDIVISRTRFFFPTLMALWYAHGQNIPLLHIEHGSDFAQFNNVIKTTLGKMYDWILGRFVLRHADALIGNSHASAHFVNKLSGRNNCHIIYRGTNKNIENIQPYQNIRAQYHNKTIIAFIGRLIDGKGVDDLITAIAKLEREDIVCFIIGSGPKENQLKKTVQEYHRKHQIVFFGNLPFDEAIAILKTADIVVNPSYTEGLPTSVTEAALCHKAIIATDVGGTNEIIDGIDDGILIPPKRPNILAEKLELLINDAELRAK
ncbi:MAG TPA: glycosyltransferase family 4 protein, partial [Patescibacteria group bacterium]|nr:glycosyltransferase family 4 protein [Patescibacteria group bacterium]